MGGDVRNVDSLIEAMTEGGDVDAVVHLASIRRENGADTYEDININGTRNVIEACKRSKVSRLITVSCLGAEGRSPYPLLRSIGKTEEAVRNSGLNFTVLKSAVVYGEGDWLTSWMKGIISDMPLVMPLPHRGETKIQPIWVGDLAACIDRCISTRSTYRQIVPVGGPQAITLLDIANLTMKACEKQRRIVRVPTRFTNQVANLLTRCRHALTEPEIDALSYNRTTEIGGVHRVFGFVPAKMQTKLGYLSPHFEPAPLPVRFNRA
jgi:NADH dehydrogenase